MKLSSQEEYGLRCLLRLAQQHPGDSLTIPEIGAAEGISPHNVAKYLRATSVTGTDAKVVFAGGVNVFDDLDKAGAPLVLSGAAGEGMNISHATTGIDAGTVDYTVESASFDVVLDGGAPEAFTTGTAGTVKSASGGRVTLTFGLGFMGQTLSGTLRVSGAPLRLQTRADGGGARSLWLDSFAPSQLGRGADDDTFASVANIDLEIGGGGDAAISVIDQALEDVTTQRSALGTTMSRDLEADLAVNRSELNALTAAESTLADVNIARALSQVVREQLTLDTNIAALKAATDLRAYAFSVLIQGNPPGTAAAESELAKAVRPGGSDSDGGGTSPTFGFS